MNISLFADEMITKTAKLKYGDDKIEKTLVFQEIDMQTAKDMIIKNHYSHKWNAGFGKINIGVFVDNRLLGVAVFGNLMIPKSYYLFADDLKQDEIIELNRLWVDDELGGNTETILLSASWKLIKRFYPHIRLVQSFADGRLGCGTIYKASSFDYYGYSETLFFENIETGDTYHNVPFNNTMRPDGMIKLVTMWVQDKLRLFFTKTYRYLFKLDKSLKIKLEQLPYPSYSKGLEYVDKSNLGHAGNVIARAYILAKLLGYDEQQIIKDYVTKDMLIEMLTNKSIIAIAKQRDVWSDYVKMCEHYGVTPPEQSSSRQQEQDTDTTLFDLEQDYQGDEQND